MAKYLLKNIVILDLFKNTVKEFPEGYIHFEKDDEWRRVFFSNGKITSASSSCKSDYLGQYLMSFGVLDPTQFESAYKDGFETKESMDTVLNYVSPDVLKPLIHEKIINTIFIATRWPEGEYSVVCEKQDKYYDVDVELTIKEIETGLKERIEEFQNILETVPELGSRPKIDYMESRGFSISHQKETILNYIVSGKTINDIMSSLPAHNYLLLKCIFQLVRMGILLKGTGSPLSKEEIIKLVNDSKKSKKTDVPVLNYSLDSSVIEKTQMEIGEHKYRAEINKYRKLSEEFPENSLYVSLYEKAKSFFTVYFYSNRLSPFSVLEAIDIVEKVPDLSEVDIEVFYEVRKNEEEGISIKNLISSMQERHEVDILVSVGKLMDFEVIRESEPNFFIDAVKLGRNDCYEKLFNKKERNDLFDINICENLTPLMLSVVTANYPKEIAEELGVNSSEIGEKKVIHDYKMTPLMLSAMLGNYEAAEFLLSNNVKIDKHNGNGVTPLMLALENKHDDVASLLLRKGANVNAENKHGYSALMIAASRGLSHIVDYMIRLGVDVNHVNVHGQTALISALRFNHEDVVVSLIAAGTDLNNKDEEGRAPIDYAESVAVTELIRKGARHSKQIKRKRLKKRKRELQAYKRNLVKDEKEVVPGSFPVFVFGTLVLVTALINVYLLFFSDDRYKMSAQAESVMEQLGEDYCLKFKECRSKIPKHVLDNCNKMGKDKVSEYFKLAQSCGQNAVRECSECIRTLKCEEFRQLNGFNLSDYCYECINACEYHN